MFREIVHGQCPASFDWRGLVGMSIFISVAPKSYGKSVIKSQIQAELRVFETVISMYQRQYKYLLVHKFILAN